MNKKGFTLIEIIATVALLAILMLIAGPNLIKHYNQSKIDAMVIQEGKLVESGSILIQDYCKNPLNEGYQLQCDEYFQDTNELIEEDEKLYYTKYICVRDLKKLGYYSEDLKFSGENCSGAVVYKIDEETDMEVDNFSYVKCGEDYTSTLPEGINIESFKECFDVEVPGGGETPSEPAKEYNYLVTFSEITPFGMKVGTDASGKLTGGANLKIELPPDYETEANRFQPFIHSASPNVKSNLSIVTENGKKYLTGKMPNESLTVRIVYGIEQYRVVVNYVEYMSGRVMDSQYETSLFFGERLDIPHKDFDNFEIIEPSKLEITMEQEDVTVDVIYRQIDFNLTYDEEGGSNACTDTKVSYLKPFGTLCTQTKKTGYHLDDNLGAWYLGDNGTGTLIKSDTINEYYNDVVLHAKWRNNNYNVTYNCNGGTGSMSPSTHTYDISSNLTANTCAKTGNHFSRWTTNSNNTGNAYSNGQSVINLTSDKDGIVPLYAQWAVNNYTVAYNCNGGTGSTASSSHTYGVYRNLSNNNCLRTGYRFDGWTISSSGSGTVYTNQQSVVNLTTSNNVTVTLYAKWTRCGSGTYLVNNTCTACPAGKYSAGGVNSCSTCAAGTYSGSGASSCTACAAGKFSTAGSSSCSTCPAGYYCPGGTNKLACAAGKYSSGGASSCSTCPSGYYCPGSTDKKVCAAGTYSGSGASSCSTCTAGYYCPGGTNRVACTAGTYSGSGATSCTGCPAGKYNTSSASDSCTTCPAGKYNTGTGNTSCKTCDVGYYCTGGSNRTACPAGTYSTGGASGCTTCPAGSYCPGGTNKVACPTGYTSAAGATAQNKCYISVGAGKYIASANSSTQTSCAAGTYKAAHTVNYGSTSSCSACPSGKYSSSGAGSCSTCAAGTYSTGGSSSCTSCTAGYYCLGNSNQVACPSGYTSAAGATAQNECYISVAAGKYLATANGTTTTSCAAGKYKAAHTVYYGSTSSCSTCPSGYTSAAGATAQSKCYISVAAGKYLGTANSSTVTSCAAGTYKAAHNVNYGSTSSCSTCPSGYTSAAGATAQSKCYISVAAGNYLGTANSSTVTSCAAGKYKAAHTVYYGSTSSCSTCPSGYTSAAGATAQNKCYISIAAGYYLGTANGTSATACAAGKYKAAHTVYYGSTSSCSTCPSGYTSAAGATAQSKCYISVAAGNYLGTANGTSVTSCAAGKYKAAHTVYYGSTSSCSACPSGYTSAAGATAQNKCYISIAAGNYLGTANGTSATACAAGKYKAAHTVNYGSTSSCSTCPSGYTSAAGATAQNKCYISISAGYYLGTANGTTATACAAGKYKAAHTVNYGSTSSCATCAAGTYNTGTGNTGCTTCPAGYYCTGGTNKTACASGTTSDAGATAASSCYTLYKDEWVAGVSGTTEFERSGHKSWASGGNVRLVWQEYYNSYTNQSYLRFTAFQAISGSGIGVMYVGGSSSQTRGIFVLDSAGNKETIQRMNYTAGDTNFNFLNSTVNTWINVNTYSTSPTTSPPWESKIYDHNSDGTLTLTLRVDLLILTIDSSNYGSWNNVDKTITLTDLR